jgi:hypothetical protein
MRLTLRQRFFAYSGPFWLAASAGAAVVAWMVFPLLRTSLTGFALSLPLIAIGAALGALLALFPGCFVIGPLMRWAAERNGAPFSVGDDVLILRGQHRGKVLRVYEVWRERGQVRVELGKTERAAVTDVFWDLWVCRCTDGEYNLQ